MIGPYPPELALPAAQHEERAKTTTGHAHPAPWITTLIKALRRHAHIDIHVFSHSRSVSRTCSAEIDGVTYTFIKKFEPIRTDPYHLYLPAILQFTPRIKAYSPDIVHGFGTEGAYGLVTARQNYPRVVFIQGIVNQLAPYTSKSKLNVTIRAALEKHVVSRCDGIVAETGFAQRWAAGVKPDAEIAVIPHGSSPEFFKARPSFTRKRIVCIGGLSRIKGCTTVLEAFIHGKKRSPQLADDASLVFIGDGILRARLQSRVDEYGMTDCVHLLGSIPHAQIVSELEKASVLAIGSRMDTSPNVITEAHAAGLPVVGTKAGGIPDMIAEGVDGFVVPVDDSAAMWQRLHRLLQDANLCRQMGLAGREKVSTLNDAAVIADLHLDFYQRIVSGNTK